MKRFAIHSRHRTAIVAAFLALWLAPPAPAMADIAAEVRSLTGAHTRLVWVQVIGTPRRHPCRLVGLDSDDGLGTRTIVPRLKNCEKPLILPGGKRIVFSNRSTGGVYVVNWNGEGLRRLLTGYATDVWKDPATGTEWVYARPGVEKMESPIWRFRIDHPEVKELVWNKTPLDSVDIPWFQVSADGTHAGAAFPWPRCSVAVLPNQSVQLCGEGCWPSLAPDNSYRLFHLDGAHKHIILYDDGGTNRRTITLNDAPGINGRTIYYPKWTRDARFLTMTGPSYDELSDFYIGRFNATFTGIEKWVRVTHNNFPDRWGDAWIDPELGRFTGKAPYTVSFKAGDGAWSWIYGDGSTGTGSASSHTYEKAGTYAVTASLGGRTLSGSVQALEPAPPRVVAIRPIDDRRLAVSFSERVQLKSPRISLEGLGPAKSCALDPEDRDLLIELPKPLQMDDWLLLDGIYDRSQVPEKLRQERLAVVRPAWPSNRSDLQLLWETNNDPALRMDTGRMITQPFILDRGGIARFDRNGLMSLAGGSFASDEPGYHFGVADAVNSSKQFSVEATLYPVDGPQGAPGKPALILYFGWRFAAAGSGAAVDQGNRNFWLGQRGHDLLFSLRTAGQPMSPTDSVVLGGLPEKGPVHVLVSYQAGLLTCYLNGKETARTGAIGGAPVWVPSMLTFGRDSGDLGTPWRGKIEGFALYSRAVNAFEAQQNHAAYWQKIAQRKSLPQIEVEAKLVARSPAPNPAQLAPYHNALVVYEYQVEKVLAGTYNQGKIRVAHWGLIEKQPTPIADAKIGSSYKLILEDFKAHPELEPEFLSDTLPQDFELGLYYDASN